MGGNLLSDHEIASKVEDKTLKVTGLSQSTSTRIKLTKECAIQPSSLDLHVGLIFVPPDTELDLNTDPPPQQPVGAKGYKIPPGKTIVVETFEFLEFNDTTAAFGFPPASLARNAILMANPGHIDPGYSGKLSFTLINMGRDDYPINQGDPIVSLMVFALNPAVEADYAKRRDNKIPSPDYREVLNNLAPDFGNFTKRMSFAATNAVVEEAHKLDRQKLWLPVVAGAFATVFVAGVVWFTNTLPSLGLIVTKSNLAEFVEKELSPLEQKLLNLKKEIRALTNSRDVLDMDSRLDVIENQLKKIPKTKSAPN